ncbi:MAG: JAB domain-containing protein [Chitinophagales bacterium]
MLFHLALETTACAIILTHNHPSGNLKLSRTVIDLTA